MNAVRVKLALLGAAAAAAAGGCSRAVEEPAPPLPAPRLETPADWPVYRGDRRLVGRAEGSVPDRLAVRWTFRAGGPIFSSVVVQDGLAVFGANDGKVYAVGTDDGKERWSRDLGQDVEATPCLVGDAAYVGCADGMLYALDLAGGDVRWTYEAEDRVLGAANWVPAPDGTNVWILIGSYDARLHCVDARTGEPAWTFETDNYINGSPAVDGDLAFFGGCDELVHGIRTADGSEAMSVNVGSYVAGSPAVDNGVVYAGHYGGALVAVDLEGERVAIKIGQQN